MKMKSLNNCVDSLLKCSIFLPDFAVDMHAFCMSLIYPRLDCRFFKAEYLFLSPCKYTEGTQENNSSTEGKSLAPKV